MKRKIRRSNEVALTLTGIVIIFGSVLFAAAVGIQLQWEATSRSLTMPLLYWN